MGLKLNFVAIIRMVKSKTLVFTRTHTHRERTNGLLKRSHLLLLSNFNIWAKTLLLGAKKKFAFFKIIIILLPIKTRDIKSYGNMVQILSFYFPPFVRSFFRVFEISVTFLF